MIKKEIILNKLYNIYNKISQNSKYTLALKDCLWFLILDIKNTNKAEFIQNDVFNLLKNEFNIKSKGIGYILDLKNN